MNHIDRNKDLRIPKESLIPGHYYAGTCRNANIARWDGKHFHHWREKFGRVFLEDISCFEDEEYFDVFIPLVDITRDHGKEIPLPEEPVNG